MQILVHINQQVEDLLLRIKSGYVSNDGNLFSAHPESYYKLCSEKILKAITAKT